MSVLWKWEAVLDAKFLWKSYSGQRWADIVKLPQGNYVYGIGAFGVPLYVGRTATLYKRLCEHLHQNSSYSPITELMVKFPTVVQQWTVRACRYHTSDTQAEGRIIQKLRPCLNISKNPNPRPLPEPLFSLDLEYQKLITACVHKVMKDKNE